ncbi:MAG TPA: hypothetical protein VJY33_21920 [Isosphaeraceae bacterium]|nr:hypothetical protein [Isosphaeraceae bacterium]
MTVSVRPASVFKRGSDARREGRQAADQGVGQLGTAECTGSRGGGRDHLGSRGLAFARSPVWRRKHPVQDPREGARQRQHPQQRLEGRLRRAVPLVKLVDGTLGEHNRAFLVVRPTLG